MEALHVEAPPFVYIMTICLISAILQFIILHLGKFPHAHLILKRFLHLCIFLEQLGV